MLASYCFFFWFQYEKEEILLEHRIHQSLWTFRYSLMFCGFHRAYLEFYLDRSHEKIRYWQTVRTRFSHHYRTESFSLEIMDAMLMSSLLCSSDVIAAISLIKYEEQPQLFSIIFGEGIYNDAVSIILFDTVS